jgi:arsenical pump membrane protein
LRRLVVVAGVAGLCLLAAGDRAGREAIGAAVPAFVTIAALLALGALADAEGLFERSAARIGRLPGGGAALYAGCAALVVATTALFNLDTAVVFVTPVVVRAAALRGLDPLPFAYLAVLGANAGSLLTPAANPTTLILLDASGHGGGTLFAASWAGAAIAAAAVIVALALVSRARLLAPVARAAGGGVRGQRSGWLSLAGVIAVAASVLAFHDTPLPVATVALAVLAVAVVRGTTTWPAALRSAEPIKLCLLFGLAVVTGWIGRTVDLGAVVAGFGPGMTTVAGVVAALAFNNLPAASAFGDVEPERLPYLLLGLNLGPNLAVTGALSALLWWTTARRAGVRPSVGRFSALGAMTTVPALVLAYLGLRGLRA